MQPYGLDIMAQARDAIAVALPQYVRNVAFTGLRTGPRRVVVVVKALIVPDGYSEPMMDTAPDTSVRRIALKFPIDDWTDQTPPQIGERVIVDNVDYYVEKPERRLAHWHIMAREGVA